jgi:hypothetical protein
VFAAMPTWAWVILILFVIVLWSDHPDAVWVASSIWHGLGDVIDGLDHMLTSLRTNSSGS